MSIVSPFIVLLLVILLVYLMLNKKSSWIGKYVGNRFSKVFLIIYASLLIAALPLAVIISQEMGDKGIEVENEYDEDGWEVREDQFFNAAYEGRLEELEGILSKKWRFSVEEEQLELRFPRGEFYTSIYAERVDSLRDEIEVIYYAKPSIVNGIDFSDKIPSPQVELSGHAVHFIAPEPVEIKLISTEKEFTIAQFLEESRDRGYRSPIDLHSNALHLRIPKQMQIVESQEQYIHFVGEEE